MESWRTQISRSRTQEHRMWILAGRQGAGPLERIEDIDFSGARFSGLTFEYATIARCLFSDTGIEYARFNNARFVDCWAVTANLSHCRFYDVMIERCRFPRVDFRWGAFPGAQLLGSTFESSAFANCAFVDAKVQDCSFLSSGFEAAQLDRSHFLNCDFRDTLLSGSSNAGRCFETHFENCDFRNANVEQRRFRDATFTRCKFAGMKGRAVMDGPIHVVDPDFSEAGDGSDIRTSEALLSQWSRQG